MASLSQNLNVPPGVIKPQGLITVPEGWLLCNGQAISRTTYSRLFARIGTTYGVGNGSTTFNVPDLRGEFISGHDVSYDPGRAFGTVQAGQQGRHNHNQGTLTLNNANAAHNHPLLGSIGNVAIPHSHTLNQAPSPSPLSFRGVQQTALRLFQPGPLASSRYASSSTPETTGSTTVPHNHTVSLTPVTAPHTHIVSGSVGNFPTPAPVEETRPRNLALVYLIKY